MERSHQLCVLFFVFLVVWFLLLNGSNGAVSREHSSGYEASERLTNWFLNRSSNPETADDFSHELHRTAAALFAGGKFGSRVTLKDEIAYKLTIQLLIKLSSNKPLSSKELALYINGLVAVCIDPKKFHGRDLVSTLRAMVEAERYTNPIEIIALCNAGDTVTEKDVERMTEAYYMPRRSFWRDTQEQVIIALSCIFSQNYMSVNETLLRNMIERFVPPEYSFDNMRTAALMLQGRSAAGRFINYTTTYDKRLPIAVESMMYAMILENSITFLDFYYLLPALVGKSLHYSKSALLFGCLKSEETEVLKKFQEQKGERIQVGYSILIGNDFDKDRSWKLKVPSGSSLYDVMKTVRQLDSSYDFAYNTVDDKPYPSDMLGYQNDPDTDFYWFVYKRAPESKVPELVELSPLDVKIKENEVLILWYKNADWNSEENLLEATTRIESQVTTAMSFDTVDDITIA